MNRTNTRRLAVSASFAALLCAMPIQFAISQQTLLAPSTSSSIRHELFADSPGESYLRYLQTTGQVPLYPWSLRSFSQREIGKLVPKDSLNPWSGRFADDSRPLYRGIRYGFIQPSVSLRYNNAFAYGSNDGPIWAGRGLTTAAQAGVYAVWGPASLTIAPTVFRAENKAFDIVPNGRPGNAAFGNAAFGGIDLPQRFGNSAYSQFDPGQSTLRFDVRFVSAGVTTANEAWGPAQEFPILLGNNAAGFPHIFAGTSEPLNLYVAKVHARAMWGELFQSDYSPVTGPEDYTSKAEPGTRRFATGLVVSVEPRGITGLEVGGARFFHLIWPISGLPRSYFTQFLEGFLKKDIKPDRLRDPRFPQGSDQTGISSNQLLSLFARWVLPNSGFELHAEYGREDHSYDLRDLTQEPDHSRAYSFGARKVFFTSGESMTAGRFEIMNFQLPQLARYRGEGEFYVHGLIRQGHTYKGQLLGADAGVGTGAGSVAAVDHYTKYGSWTASWHRIVNQEDGNYVALGVRNPRSIDVSHALGFEMTRFMGQFDLNGGVTFVRDFNRNFTSDVNNLNVIVGARYKLH